MIHKSEWKLIMVLSLRDQKIEIQSIVYKRPIYYIVVIEQAHILANLSQNT